MKVSVFGGSQTRPGTPDYEEAFRLGRLLGSAGYTVLTGGYMGVMEAASRGANEAGGHVVGVTCDEIERWRPVGANPWVREEWRRPSLRDRLNTLIDSCDAAIAMPGGPGTLAEVALTWNLLLTGAISPKPLILIGEAWRASLAALYEAFAEYIPAGQRAWLSFASCADEAVKLLQSNHDPKAGRG